MAYDDEEEEDMHRLAHLQQSMAVVVIAIQQKKKKRKIDHRTLPRLEKKQYEHQRAYQCIMKDYLGPGPLFDGREFDVSFRNQQKTVPKAARRLW